MPRLKGADVQFIIYVPHDGRSVSHEAKIKKNKTTDRLISFRALRPTPVLYHPVISSPRAAITPNVLSPLVHLTLFFVSLPLVYPPHTHTKPVFSSPCASSRFLPSVSSSSRPRQRTVFARNQVTAAALTSLPSRETLGIERCNCAVVEKDESPFD